MATSILELQLLLKGCLDRDAKMLREFEDRSYLRTVRRAVREVLQTRLDQVEVDHAINLAVTAIYRGWNRLPYDGDLRERIRAYAVAVAEKFYVQWAAERLQTKP